MDFQRSLLVRITTIIISIVFLTASNDIKQAQHIAELNQNTTFTQLDVQSESDLHNLIHNHDLVIRCVIIVLCSVLILKFKHATISVSFTGSSTLHCL